MSENFHFKLLFQDLILILLPL